MTILKEFLEANGLLIWSLGLVGFSFWTGWTCGRQDLKDRNKQEVVNK